MNLTRYLVLALMLLVGIVAGGKLKLLGFKGKHFGLLGLKVRTPKLLGFGHGGLGGHGHGGFGGGGFGGGGFHNSGYEHHEYHESHHSEGGAFGGGAFGGGFLGK